MSDKHNQNEEELYEDIEIDAPECFSYFDDRDPACRRCELKDYCVDEQTQERTPCFGELYSPDSEECAGCLDASSCAEKSIS